MFQNVQQIQDFIRQNGIAFLDFKMIDLRGRWKHLSIPAARFNEDIMTARHRLRRLELRLCPG